MTESLRPSLPKGGRAAPAEPRDFKSSTEVPSSRRDSAEREITNPRDVHINGLAGSGVTADVYRGTLRGHTVAVKMMTRGRLMNAKEQVDFNREVEVLSRIDHRNLVRLYGVTLCQRPYQIVTEFCEGGTVFDLMHNRPDVELTWGQKIKMVIDVACAMSYLHGCDPPILHRDLKSLNLLLAEAVRGPKDRVRVKVSDFGLSKVTSETDDKMTLRIGTLRWMAPEMLIAETYDEKVDVYSYSMVLFEIVCREIPFEEVETTDIEELVSQGGRPDIVAVPPDCPPKLRTSMIACWAQDPIQRPSFPEILEILLAMDRGLNVG